MRYLLALCLIVSVASTAYGGPQYEQNPFIQNLQRRIVLSGSTKHVIEKLTETLQKLAEEARQAISSFNSGVQNEAARIRDRISTDIQTLRGRVSTTIDNVNDKLIDSGVGIVGCVSTSREEAAVLFNVTITKSLACVNDRVKDITEQINGLNSFVTDTVTFSNQVVEDMNQCSKDNGNILSIGACLGNVALHADLKVVTFATHSAITVGRLGLSMATLPAALEVCAGTRLVEAGISTTRIIMEIGSCSASAVYGSISGSNNKNPELAANPEQLPNLAESAANSEAADLLRANFDNIDFIPKELVVFRQ